MTQDLEDLKNAYLSAKSQTGDTYTAAKEALFNAVIERIQKDPTDEALVFLSQSDFKELKTDIRYWLQQQSKLKSDFINSNPIHKPNPTPGYGVSAGGILIAKGIDPSSNGLKK